VKLIDNRKPTSPPEIRVREIASDTVFTGRIGNYSGVFVMTFYGAVLLTDPTGTKSWEANNGSVVYDYQPVEVELTILKNL
jgi:hypothetical protein